MPGNNIRRNDSCPCGSREIARGAAVL